MHPFEGPAFLLWLETSGFAQAMRHWLWLYPMVEIVHITGIAFLVGASAMFNLRVLGMSRNLSIIALGRHLLPWSVAGFVVLVITGSMMFAAHATEFWYNPAFITKMSLIVFAGLNVLTFHFGIYSTATVWDVEVAAPAAARIQAAGSLVLWIGVIACGRLIAYL
jgi:hypothetical protein